MEKLKNKNSGIFLSETRRDNKKGSTNFVSSKRLFMGIFIISASVLAFEIIITRISSIVFAYNYVFVVISFAILGLGCGGIFAFYKWRTQENRGLNNVNNILSFYGILYALSVALFIILITSVSFFIYIIPFFAVSFLPFFFAGFLLAIIFRALPLESFKIYAFDLLGASTGAILVVLALNKFGGVDIVLFISILGLIASFLFLKWKNKRRMSFKKISSIVAITLFCVLLLVSNILFGFLGEVPSRTEQLKELGSLLAQQDSEIADSRWSAFGRVDLVRLLEDDSAMWLFVDGTAGTVMYKFDGNIEDAYDQVEFREKDLIGMFPFIFLDEDEKNSMLVIGPGGGQEDLLGLVNVVDNIKEIDFLTNSIFLEKLK